MKKEAPRRMKPWIFLFFSVFFPLLPRCWAAGMRSFIGPRNRRCLPVSPLASPNSVRKRLTNHQTLNSGRFSFCSTLLLAGARLVSMRSAPWSGRLGPAESNGWENVDVDRLRSVKCHVGQGSGRWKREKMKHVGHLVTRWNGFGSTEKQEFQASSLSLALLQSNCVRVPTPSPDSAVTQDSKNQVRYFASIKGRATGKQPRRRLTRSYCYRNWWSGIQFFCPLRVRSPPSAALAFGIDNESWLGTIKRRLRFHSRRAVWQPSRKDHTGLTKTNQKNSIKWEK